MELPQLRKSPVLFNAADHTYMLGGRYLKGVTGTLVRRAYPNTYSVPDGMTKEQWKEKLDNAARKGTAVHQMIELYEDLGVLSDSPELKNYIDVKETGGFVNLATEYLVSDEEYYASSIDHVWVSEKGQIVLVDIKHTYNIHWDEVTCQLSIYKRFFEMQNPDLSVAGIAVLWLRDDNVQFKYLTPFADEVIDQLIAADIKDEKFDIQQCFGELPVKFADAEEQIAFLNMKIKEMTEEYDKLKSGLFSLMEQHGVTKFTGSKVMLTVSGPSTRESIDTSRLKLEAPDVYEKYKKCINVKPSLRITVRK